VVPRQVDSERDRQHARRQRHLAGVVSEEARHARILHRPLLPAPVGRLLIQSVGSKARQALIRAVSFYPRAGASLSPQSAPGLVEVDARHQDGAGQHARREYQRNGDQDRRWIRGTEPKEMT